MTEERFKELAAKAADFDDINLLCLAWLTAAAEEEAPKVRAMLLSSIEAVRRGIE